VRPTTRPVSGGRRPPHMHEIQSACLETKRRQDQPCVENSMLKEKRGGGGEKDPPRGIASLNRAARDNGKRKENRSPSASCAKSY